jgi:hypothetical protein
MNVRKLIRRVTVETDRTYIFRNRDAARVLWCSKCGQEMGMASVAAAAQVKGVSEMAIYELINSAAIHFAEDAKGSLLICLNSLQHESSRAEGERS